MIARTHTERARILKKYTRSIMQAAKWPLPAATPCQPHEECSARVETHERSFGTHLRIWVATASKSPFWLCTSTAAVVREREGSTAVIR